MSESWDEYAAEWDDNPGAHAYATAAFGSLVEVLDQCGVTLDGARVCDFGCGTGLLTEQLVDAVESVDAVDTSPLMLAVLARKVDASGWDHVRTQLDLPTSSGSHDLVVCSSVCGFLDDYPATLRRLAALLRPGGVFVQWDWERDDGDEPGDGLTRDEIQGAFSAAGLTTRRVGVGFTVESDGYAMRPLIGVGQKPS